MKLFYCQFRKYRISVVIVLMLGAFWSHLAMADTPSSSAPCRLVRSAPSAPSVPKAYPFGKKRPKPKADETLQKKINKVVSIQGKNVAVDTPVTFSGRPQEPPKDTDLRPRRSTFPGKSDTLSQMDEESPSQLNVFYKLDEQATAHMAVNQQDINSPTYTPIKKEEGLNAAGMYLNVGVHENIKVKVGGEVRTHETVSDDSGDKSSAGAQVGLQWNF